MKFRRLRTTLGLAVFLAAATAGAGFAQLGGNPNAPPPPPLPNINRDATSQTTNGPVTPPPPTLAPTAIASAIAPAGIGAPSASPSPVASGGPRRGRRAPSPGGTPSPEPTDSPVPPQFSTLDGIWEIEIQPPGSRLARYEHFNIVQKGSALTGYWEHDPKKTRTPITGTFDGRLIQISADYNEATVSFSGYVEDFGDMVGMRKLSDKDNGLAFTAQHRKRERG